MIVIGVSMETELYRPLCNYQSARYGDQTVSIKIQVSNPLNLSPSHARHEYTITAVILATVSFVVSQICKAFTLPTAIQQQKQTTSCALA